MFYRPAQPVPCDALLQRNVEFTRTAWRAGLRCDQRGPHQLRELSVEFPLLSRDLVQVRCGGTCATASVSCELVEPSPFRPKHGFFDVHVRQLLNERDSITKPKEVKRLGMYLERLFKGSVIETEALCVLPGRRVWSITVSALVINDDGNALDVVQWAVLAALMHVRRPELTIRGDTVIVHPPHERDPVPLALHHLPVSCSYVVTQDPQRMELEARAAVLRAAGGPGAAGHSGVSPAVSPDVVLRVVVDPTAEEATAAATSIVIAVNGEGQVCAMEKGEGCDVPWELMQECMHTTLLLAPPILETIQVAMATHDKKREEALKGQFLWAQKRTGVGRAEVAPAPPPTEVSGKTDAPAPQRPRVE